VATVTVKAGRGLDLAGSAAQAAPTIAKKKAAQAEQADQADQGAWARNVELMRLDWNSLKGRSVFMVKH
jgi:hypothetical protein